MSAESRTTPISRAVRSTGENAPHDIRVKISRSSKAIPENLISVALRPELRVTGNEELSKEELGLLNQWVKLNWDTLLAYWNGEIFTKQAVARLKAIQ